MGETGLFSGIFIAHWNPNAREVCNGSGSDELSCLSERRSTLLQCAFPAERPANKAYFHRFGGRNHARSQESCHTQTRQNGQWLYNECRSHAFASSFCG